MTCTSSIPRLALLLTALSGTAQAADWVGLAQVIDGQTLIINGQRLRLAGIEAAGGNRTCTDYSYNVNYCGYISRYHLIELASSERVTCSGNERDENRIPLVRCTIGDLNLNRQMVRDGWATSEEYRAEQELAKKEKAGMWFGPSY